MYPAFSRVGIVGTGAMGKGIAQLAAQAGSEVVIFDTKAGLAEAARHDLEAQWTKLAAKGKLGAETADDCVKRVAAVSHLQELAACDLVVEAVVEDLGIKRALIADLISLTPDTTILASNTSSLSITEVAAGLGRESRTVGFHFFNPAPVMPIVEIIPGLKTDPEVVRLLVLYAGQFGHTPVVARDTPGFIVNHAGRGYGTEALRILSERIADHATIDTILKDQLGFRLGPFELFDLTGLDVSHPVMESVYNQYFQEPRYRPNVITRQRVSANLLGKKTGEGFYAYPNGQISKPTEPPPPDVPHLPPVWVSPKAARRQELYQLLKTLDARIETGASPSEQALIIVAPLGFDVTTVAAVERLDPTRTIGIDMLLEDATTRRRVLATNPATRADMRDAGWALFSRDRKSVSVIRDSAGFVSQRVLAHIVNIASDMCQQGICTPSDLDIAVTLGLGYPKGPLAMGNHVGPGNVLEILFNMQTVYGDPRYRPSPWLRRRGALGLSLHQEEA
jgi:3-hydroxybutyryl-CoA dehydrogenase